MYCNILYLGQMLLQSGTGGAKGAEMSHGCGWVLERQACFIVVDAGGRRQMKNVCM